MAYFQTKKVKTIPLPIPDEPGYIPPTPPTPPAAEDGDAPEIIRPGLTSASTITLYKVYDENEKVNKSLHSEVSFQIALVEAQDVLEPVVVLETSIDLTQYNYAYIDTLHRYYYMHVVCLPDTRFRLIMNIDVLKSYASGIYGCVGTLNKCEDKRHQDLDISDSEYVYEEGNALKISAFHPQPGETYFLQDPKAILVACGGIGTDE